MPTRSTEAQAESPTHRIHRVYADLPEGERKAADLILDMPSELSVWSASELAEQAGVSNATISRFIRRLGYASFEEARRAARALRAVGSPLYLADGAKGASRGLLDRHLVVETSLIFSPMRAACESPGFATATSPLNTPAPCLRNSVRASKC